MSCRTAGIRHGAMPGITGNGAMKSQPAVCPWLPGSVFSIANRQSPIENLRPSPLSTLPSLLIRSATLADLPAIDALQKKHSRRLGVFPRAQMEGYIRNGWVLVACATEESGCTRFRTLMGFQIVRARRLYAEGARGLASLPGSRQTAAIMATVYGGILGAIERLGCNVFLAAGAPQYAVKARTIAGGDAVIGSRRG